MSSPPAASARPMTTSPPTPSPRRWASRSTIIPRRWSASSARFGADLNEARLRMARIPEGATLIAQQRVQGAGLHDRQCHRDGGRAVDHAGDAGYRRAEAFDRRQDAVRDREAPMRAKAMSARRCAKSRPLIPTPSSAATRIMTRMDTPTRTLSCVRAMRRNSQPRWMPSRRCWCRLKDAR